MDLRDKRQFEDDLIEAALQARAKAEPRAGLEERILAGLEARHARPRGALVRWAWAFGGVAAVAAIVAVIVLRHPAVPVTPVSPAAPPEIAKTSKPAVTRPVSVRMPPPAANSKTVRLAVFPAPRPLSPEEKMLLAYVKKCHLGEASHDTLLPLDEDLKVPKLEVAALDVKPIESTEESPEK